MRRPGIVHRLDKDTSGLLVVAKTDAAHRGLAELFADHGRSGSLEREYLALVWGAFEATAGKVDAAIARHPRQREKMAVAAAERGRHAVTHWRLEEALGPASLIACRLETGRTHQIRVHMASIGHPLIGDSVYGAGYKTKMSQLIGGAKERCRRVRTSGPARRCAWLRASDHRRAASVRKLCRPRICRGSSALCGRNATKPAERAKSPALILGRQRFGIALVARPFFGHAFWTKMVMRPIAPTETARHRSSTGGLSWPRPYPIIAGKSGLARYLQEIKRFPMLEPQEEYMLAKRWREHNDREAAHKLVTSHLRLVAKIAMGYRGYGLPIGEVISEGNVGLMQAVKRFEPDKGFKLATYAMWWIRASIQEYILRSWSLVKMGTTASQKKLFFNLRKAKSRISALDEGDLRDDQVESISKRLGVAKQDVIEMNRRLGGDASLNAPLREEGEGEWQDWLVDESGRSGIDAGRPRGVGRPSRRAQERPFRAEPARAPHFRGAAARRGSDHARGAVGRVRGVARTRAADRGARLREGAGGGQGGGRQGAGSEAAAPAALPAR